MDEYAAGRKTTCYSYYSTNICRSVIAGHLEEAGANSLIKRTMHLIICVKCFCRAI